MVETDLLYRYQRMPVITQAVAALANTTLHPSERGDDGELMRVNSDTPNGHTMQENPRNPAQEIPPSFIALAVWLPLLRGLTFYCGSGSGSGCLLGCRRTLCAHVAGRWE